MNFLILDWILKLFFRWKNCCDQYRTKIEWEFKIYDSEEAHREVFNSFCAITLVFNAFNERELVKFDHK